MVKLCKLNYFFFHLGGEFQLATHFYLTWIEKKVGTYFINNGDMFDLEVQNCLLYGENEKEAHDNDKLSQRIIYVHAIFFLHLQQNLDKTSAPIGAWMCNFPPFLEIITTD